MTYYSCLLIKFKYFQLKEFKQPESTNLKLSPYIYYTFVKYRTYKILMPNDNSSTN